MRGLDQFVVSEKKIAMQATTCLCCPEYFEMCLNLFLCKLHGHVLSIRLSLRNYQLSICAGPAFCFSLSKATGDMLS